MDKIINGKARILVVDDEEYTRGFFRNLLGDEGYEVVTCTNGAKALRLCTQKAFDLILLDLRLPGNIDGIQVLQEIKKISPETVVIMISAHGTLERAVEAVKLGAENFLSKPFSGIEDILFHIEKALELQKITHDNLFFHEQLAHQMDSQNMIGNSPKMQEVFALIRKVSSLDTNILLIGESGTGKELAAQAVHNNSPRRDKRFMTVHCGALPENLLETTLFGYEEGAFTDAKRRTKGYFEEADGGTIFFDEIGEAPLPLQVKLLRVLQTGEFQRVGGTELLHSDIRIISATNKNLYKALEKKEFRQDLYYRINVITIYLPPLRERKEDIPLLANFFLKQHAENMNKKLPTISSEAMDLLVNFQWPGNIRQLENVIERAIALCDGDVICTSCLPPELDMLNPPVDELNIPTLSYKEAKEHFERQYLVRLLKACHNDISHAAKTAGIDPSTLYRKLNRYHLTVNG
ncbi:MAG: sigma-54-dependent transcriptional regulator [bacterium]